MLSDKTVESMEKQQYRIVGEHKHSAVKICGWTKKMLREEGGCYKLKFYGIISSKCLQMTTSISCPNRCTFCWRDYKAPVSEDWQWPTDDPEAILDQSIDAQRILLSGFKGNEKVSPEKFKEQTEIKHVALSLTGEAIMYPKINEFIDLCHKRGISTFLVTNAQYPEMIKNLRPITQLYISLDAPNKELLKKIDRPIFEDYWERYLKSLDYMQEKEGRTCIRVTCIKEINMCDLEGYSELIHRADPDFIEVKGYMFIGASMQRLKMENMPYHEDIVNFTKELVKYIPEYEIVSEHIPSRVILLAKNKYKIDGKWHTWIDFDNPTNFLPTPDVGISGKGTIKVDETTDEMEFWQPQD